MTTFLDSIEREVLREVTPKIHPHQLKRGGAFPDFPSPGRGGWLQQQVAGLIESSRRGSGS